MANDRRRVPRLILGPPNPNPPKVTDPGDLFGSNPLQGGNRPRRPSIHFPPKVFSPAGEAEYRELERIRDETLSAQLYKMDPNWGAAYPGKGLSIALIHLFGGVPSYKTTSIDRLGQLSLPGDWGPRVGRPPLPSLPSPEVDPRIKQLSLFKDPADFFMRGVVKSRQDQTQREIDDFRNRTAAAYTKHGKGVLGKPAGTLITDRNEMFTDQLADYLKDRELKNFTQLSGDVIQKIGEHPKLRGRVERALIQQAEDTGYGQLVERYKKVKKEHQEIRKARNAIKENPSDVVNIVKSNPFLHKRYQSSLEGFEASNPRDVAKTLGQELGAEQGRLGKELAELGEAGQNIKQQDFPAIDRALARLGGDSYAGISRGYDSRTSFWQDVSSPEQRAARTAEDKIALEEKMTRSANRLEKHFFELYATGKAGFGEEMGRPFIAGSGQLKGTPVTARFVNMNEWARHPRFREWLPADIMRQIDPEFQGNPAGIQAGIEVRPIAQMPEHLLTRSVFNLGPEPDTHVDPLWALLRVDPDLKNSKKVSVGNADREGARLARQEANREAAKDITRQNITRRLRATMGEGPSTVYDVSRFGGVSRRNIESLGLRSGHVDSITARRAAEETIVGSLMFPKGGLGMPGTPVSRRSLPGGMRGKEAEVTYSNLGPNYKWTLARFMREKGKFGDEYRAWIEKVAPQISYEMAQNPKLSAERMVKLLQESEVIKDLGITSQASVLQGMRAREEELRQAGGIFGDETLPLQDAALNNERFSHSGYSLDEVEDRIDAERAGILSSSRSMGLSEVRDLQRQLEEVRRHLIAMHGKVTPSRDYRLLKGREKDLLSSIRKAWFANSKNLRFQAAWQARGSQVWQRYLESALRVSPETAKDLQSYVSGVLNKRSNPFVGSLNEVSTRLSDLRDRDLTFDLGGKAGKLRLSRALEMPRYGSDAYTQGEEAAQRARVAMGRLGVNSSDYDPRRFRLWFELAGSAEEKKNTLISLGYLPEQAEQAVSGGMTSLSQIFRFEEFEKEFGKGQTVEELAQRLGIETSGLSKRSLEREVNKRTRDIAHGALKESFMMEYHQTGGMTHPTRTIRQGGRLYPEVVRNFQEGESPEQYAGSFATDVLEARGIPISGDVLMDRFRDTKIGRLVAEGGLSDMVDVLPLGNFQPLKWVDAVGNTVTQDRLNKNTAIWQRIMEDYFGKGSSVSMTNRYQTLLTSKHLLPQIPQEVGPSKPLLGAYSEAQEMLDEALKERGLSLGLVEGLSRAFGGKEGQSAIGNLTPAQISQINSRVVSGDVAHMVAEKNLYSPLSIGAQVEIPGMGRFKLGELWARANTLGPDMEDRLTDFGVRLSGKRSIGYAADAISRQVDAYRSQDLLEILPAPVQKQIYSKIPVQLSLFSQEEPPPPPAEPPGSKTAAETTKAAKTADEVISKQPAKKLLELLKTNRLAGGIALSAAAITGFSYLYRPDRDRTEQDIQGPGFLPGGSPYEPSVVAQNRLLAPAPQFFGNPIPRGGGVTYIINSNPYGDNSGYDPEQLSSQIQAMTGAYPRSTIYNSSLSVAQTREQQQNAIVSAY